MDNNPFATAIDEIKRQIVAKEESIAPLRRQIAAEEATLGPLKATANQLCKLAGIPEIYSGFDGGPAAAPDQALRFRPDQFFNRNLADCVVEYLTARKDNGPKHGPWPASVSEIYDALISGGYKFQGTSDENNKRALNIALVRNTVQMAKISDGVFGLRKWYGMRAARKPSENGDADDTSTTGTITTTSES
jgi:hypothetical protein